MAAASRNCRIRDVRSLDMPNADVARSKRKTAPSGIDPENETSTEKLRSRRLNFIKAAWLPLRYTFGLRHSGSRRSAPEPDADHQSNLSNPATACPSVIRGAADQPVPYDAGIGRDFAPYLIAQPQPGLHVIEARRHSP